MSSICPHTGRNTESDDHGHLEPCMKRSTNSLTGRHCSGNNGDNQASRSALSRRGHVGHIVLMQESTRTHSHSRSARMHVHTCKPDAHTHTCTRTRTRALKNSTRRLHKLHNKTTCRKSQRMVDNSRGVTGPCPWGRGWGIGAGVQWSSRHDSSAVSNALAFQLR